jgi:Flp pilus assembly protein TadG
MKNSRYSALRGQTLVEFALILPVFILIAVVIFDFGRAVYYYSAVHNAAREGARYGVIHPSPADYPQIEAVARNYAIGLGASDITVTVANGLPETISGVNFPNPTIKVTVLYDFRPVTPFVSALIPCGCDFIPLKGEAIMRTETLP